MQQTLSPFCTSISTVAAVFLNVWRLLAFQQSLDCTVRTVRIFCLKSFAMETFLAVDSGLISHQ